jgi:hypothetical protein
VLPAEDTICLSDVGPTPLRVIPRQCAAGQPRLGFSDVENHFSKLKNGELPKVAEINRPRHFIRRIGNQRQALT